jgi:hypothetical protein
MDQLLDWLLKNPLVLVFIGIVILIAILLGRSITLGPLKIGEKSSDDNKSLNIRVIPFLKAKHSETMLPPGTALSDPKLGQVTPPLDPNKFRLLEFPMRPDGLVTGCYKFPYTLFGIVIIYGVPFSFQPVMNQENQNTVGHHAIDIFPTNTNHRVSCEITANVERLSRIYFLIAAGNGWNSFLGKRVGYIDLVFVDSSIQRIELILGKNVREWNFGWSANLVNTVDFSLIKPAWVSHDQSHRIDFMAVDVTNGSKNLERIQVVAEYGGSYDEKFEVYPSVVISAITCEMQT